MIRDIQLTEVVFFLMERAMREIRDKTKEMFKREAFDVTIDQWIILKRISEVAHISQVEIANSTFKDPAAVTRMLDLLTKKGYVERQAKAEDRRAYEVGLTQVGLNLVELMTPKVQELRAQSLAGFSESEVDTLKKMLNKLYGNIEQI